MKQVGDSDSHSLPPIDWDHFMLVRPGSPCSLTGWGRDPSVLSVCSGFCLLLLGFTSPRLFRVPSCAGVHGGRAV